MFWPGELHGVPESGPTERLSLSPSPKGLIMTATEQKGEAKHLFIGGRLQADIESGTQKIVCQHFLFL